MPEASRFTFQPSDAHSLVEVPISTLNLFNRNLPSGGGGYSPCIEGEECPTPTISTGPFLDEHRRRPI